MNPCFLRCLLGLLQIPLWLVFLYSTVFSVSFAYAQDWQVQRKDRSSILIRRYQTMLHNDPFSSYALSKLWSMHRTASARQKLIAWYENRASSKDTSHRIVLARLWEQIGQWQKALDLYLQIPHNPKHQRLLQLSEIRCYLGLKQPNKVIQVLQPLLAAMESKQRRAMLQQILQQILASGSPEGLPWVVTQIKKESWNQTQITTIARLFAQYQQWNESFVWYQQALKHVSGQPKMMLLLELIRHQISAQSYTLALQTIQTARAMKTRHPWLAWELLQQEIVIYRAQQRLALLVAQLDRQWQHTKEEKQLLLLAQLYDELKVPSQSIPLYQRILQLRPAARTARLRLLSWFSQQNDLEELRKHLRLLIQYKHATPEHFLQFAKDLLKRSGHESQSRWNPSWKHAYHCQNQHRYRYYRNYVYGHRRRYYQRTAAQHRCTRQQWNDFRQKRWKFWSQHTATAAQKLMVQEAIQILKQCAKQYPRQWDTLQQVEDLLGRHGHAELAQQVRQKMIASVEAYVHQIETTHRLLYEEEETKSIKQVALNALRSQGVPLKRAVEVASHLYQPPHNPEHTYAQKTLPDQERTRQSWQQSICPAIARFLQPIGKRLQPAQMQQDPLLVLHLHALLQRCGVRAAVLNKTAQPIELMLRQNPQLRTAALELYLRYRLSQPVQQLLRRLRQDNESQWLSLLQPALNFRTQPQDLAFFFKQLFSFQKNWANQSQAVAAIFSKVCQYKATCQSLLPLLKTFAQQPELSMRVVISISSDLHRHSLLQGVQKRDWFSQIITTRRNKLHELQQLAEAQHLFYAPPDVNQLHHALVIYVLEHRPSPPSDIEKWGRMLEHHLRVLRPNDKFHLTKIERIDKAAARFPALYRRLLTFYLSHYNYRYKFGLEQITKRFQTRLALDDLPFLEQIYYRLPYTQRALFFASLHIRTDQPEILGWLYLFAQKHKLAAMRIVVLRRLLQLQPHNQELAYQLALALDESNAHTQESETYWLQWLRKTPEHFTSQAIRLLPKTCCADLADQRRARRLLFLAASSHGISVVWKEITLLFQQLDTPEKNQLLPALLSLPNVSETFRVQLAELAHQYQLYPWVIAVYTPLVQQPQAQPAWHRKLADALDRTGKYEQATAHWQNYIKHARISQPFEFFQNIGHAFQRENSPTLARLAYYRAWTLHPDPPQDISTAIQSLQKSGKPLEAWALWLSRQQEKTFRCFHKHATPIPPFLVKAQQLWQLNIPYQGPLALFPPCSWTLPTEHIHSLVTSLSSHLQKHPNLSIILVASGDSLLEPATDFLAQQRAQFLATALIQKGVSDQRISIKTMSGSAVCRVPSPPQVKPSASTPWYFGPSGGLPAKEPKTPSPPPSPWNPCSPFQRQVGLLLKEATDVSEAPYSLSLDQDSDQDGVPDVYDTCPLQSGKDLYGRPVAGRYPYYRRGVAGSIRHIGPSVGSGSLGSLPAGGVLSKPDCPRYSRPIQLLRIKDQELFLRSELQFYRQSTSLQYASQQTLQELAALIRMVPTLGVLHIHIHPHFPPAADRYYYPRRYPPYRHPSYRSSPSWRGSWNSPSANSTYRNQYLARQRATILQNFLIRQGIPSSHIRTHIHLEKPKTPVTSAPTRYVVFRFASPN